ncbi:hypothetical protein J6590_017350 [Homalodisca vitripennis]|nr:hypothetical protein J6590_017350 [Homalodisca vitripennis]
MMDGQTVTINPSKLVEEPMGERCRALSHMSRSRDSAGKVRAKKPSVTLNLGTNGLKVTSESPPMAGGQAGYLHGQDRSAVIHPSSSHARCCLIWLAYDNRCTRYTALVALERCWRFSSSFEEFITDFSRVWMSSYFLVFRKRIKEGRRDIVSRFVVCVECVRRSAEIANGLGGSRVGEIDISKSTRLLLAYLIRRAHFRWSPVSCCVSTATSAQISSNHSLIHPLFCSIPALPILLSCLSPYAGNRAVTQRAVDGTPLYMDGHLLLIPWTNIQRGLMALSKSATWEEVVAFSVSTFTSPSWQERVLLHVYGGKNPGNQYTTTITICSKLSIKLSN